MNTSEHDMKLFRTGEHADIRIRCEDREWLCHKGILSSRSTWFHDVVNQVTAIEPLAPGEMPSLSCTSHTADNLEIVLRFIYAQKLEPGKFGPGFSVPCACIRMYALGLDFGVHGMADFGTKELGKYLNGVLQKLSDSRLRENIVEHGHSEIQRWLRTENFIFTFIEAVYAADQIRMGEEHEDRIRPFYMLIDVFVAGKDILLFEPDFGVFIDNDIVPSFFKAVLETEREGGYKTRWMMGLIAKPTSRNGKQGICYDCDSSLKTGGTGICNPKSRVVTFTQACCKACSDKEKNRDGDGNVKWEVFNAKKDQVKGKKLG